MIDIFCVDGFSHLSIAVCYICVVCVQCNVANDTEGVLQTVRDNDIVMTVEMFEHMKNYDQLFGLVHS